MDTSRAVHYIDPATGNLSLTQRSRWIPTYATEHRSARFLIPCRLHGALHPVRNVYLTCDDTHHAITVQEFAWVLVAATSTTRLGWATARDAHSRRLRFEWNNPVQNLILTARALGTPARFRAMLAAAAALPVPDRALSLAPDSCFVRSRTHNPHDPQWEGVSKLYPVNQNTLAIIIADLGTVLAFPRYTTCEQVQAGYKLLANTICPSSDDPDDSPGIPAMRAYLHAARTLHEFLSSPIVSIMTRSLEALPA